MSDDARQQAAVGERGERGEPTSDGAHDGAGAAARSLRRQALQLLAFSMPATVIMVLSATSLLVDTYFVTRLGSAALAGVSLVFPFYLFLAMAFGGGLGVGLSVVLSVRLGRGDGAGAQRAVGSALALALGLAMAFALAFALGGRTLFASMTAEPAVLDAALRFARPIFYGAPVIALCLTLSNVLRSDKRVQAAAVMLLVSGVVNAVLNPILIHGAFGLPKLGVAGASWATVLGFAVAALVGAGALRGQRGSRLSVRLGALRVASADALAMLSIALPTLATYVVANCVFLILSLLWARFGVDALASYGLAMRLEYVLALVIYGVGAGVLTLGGEALGARRRAELTRLCWIASVGVVVVTAAVAVALLLAPRAWFELFGAAPAAVEHGARYLRVTALAYPFYALALTLNYAYQMLGRATLPLAWSMLRGFGVAVPAVALVAAPNGSVTLASAAIAASFALHAMLAAAWLPRTLARAFTASAPRPSWSELPALPDAASAGVAAALPELPTVRASAMQVSPYPWWYTALWPWYFRRPSLRNHTDLVPLPRRCAASAHDPATRPRRTVRVCAVGDIMVMQGDRVPVLDPALIDVLRSADLLLGTCEAAVGRAACDPAAEHHFLFNMPARYLAGILAQSGVPPERCYLSVANNHSGDIGADGLASTVAHLRALGVNPVGARVAGRLPFEVADLGGLRVGLAAWTHWLNLPEERAWRSPQMLQVPWRELRDEHGLDCLIGSGHWEYEWQHFPRAETRALAAQLGGAGFDLLIGSHPHTLQPLEWHGRTLCAYSLGNFCSGLGVSWAARMCNVLTVELGTEGTERGQVVGYEVHLFVQLDDGQTVSLVPLAAAPEPLRARVAARAARLVPSGGEGPVVTSPGALAEIG